MPDITDAEVERLIDHACSLALGYGASGRSDVLAEYKAAMGAYLRTGEGDGRALREMGQKAMNSGSDHNGERCGNHSCR